MPPATSSYGEATCKKRKGLVTKEIAATSMVFESLFGNLLNEMRIGEHEPLHKKAIFAFIGIRS